MLKDLVKYLYDTGEDAAKEKHARRLEWLDDSRNMFFELDGKIITQARAPRQRSHSVTTVTDLIVAARTWGTKPLVWVQPDAIILFPDDNERIDQVTLNLRLSSLFSLITSWLSPKSLEQKELLRLLRCELRDVTDARAISKSISKINFKTSESGHVSIAQGNESLGREIESMVVGASGEVLPDNLIVTTNVYSNIGEEEFTGSFNVDIEMDVASKKFIVRSLRDQVEEARNAAINDIHDRLMLGLPQGTTVLFGSP